METQHVDESPTKKELRSVVSKCPSIGELARTVDGRMTVLQSAYGRPLRWGRWIDAYAPEPDKQYKDLEHKNGKTPLERRLPDPAIGSAKRRSREMIFTCLMVGSRLKPALPREVWKQIFTWVNRAEHAF